LNDQAGVLEHAAQAKGGHKTGLGLRSFLLPASPKLQASIFLGLAVLESAIASRERSARLEDMIKTMSFFDLIEVERGTRRTHDVICWAGRKTRDDWERKDGHWRKIWEYG
jgi:hypothetical protein